MNVRDYYNDNDPGAAEWLRELIRAGEIPEGDVDERSILDIRPSDLAGYRRVHFFAGIGGWAEALRLADWPEDLPVWTGSPPCQPFSVAGKREGNNDARHLAPHFVDLVRACRPGMLFGEQVASAAVFGKAAKPSRSNTGGAPQWAWLDDLLNRLEAARYTAGANDFSSAGVGAPHIRQRTFFGAVSQERLVHRERAGLEGHGGDGDGSHEPGRLDADPTGSVGAAGAAIGLADADALGRGARPFGDVECQPVLLGQHSLGQGQNDEWGSGEGGGCSADRTDAGRYASPLHGFWRDADGLFCRDGKWRPVEPGTFPLAHGIQGRVGLLRGYGNAINPHAAARFIRAFREALEDVRMAA